ncbi:MAG: fructosamine kinase family protein [Phycisphaerales bacterium]
MSSREAIEHSLHKAALEQTIISVRDLSGGCIHRVQEVCLRDGATVIAKTNSAEHLHMFQEEADGLRALAQTNTVLVPRPLAVIESVGVAVLLMTAIKHAAVSPRAWTRFGEELARLHQTDAGHRYGFQTDNHLGVTPQPNEWCDDWVRFNAEHRLGHQLDLAAKRERLDTSEAARILAVIDALEDHIPRQPKPALLHGDLWSGNALPACDGDDATDRIGVIDPACSIGDGWADIAMMKLFGGFPDICIEAYAANIPDRAQLDSRIAVYQLYHVLNHVNLFGRSYAGQAMAIVAKLGA